MTTSTLLAPLKDSIHPVQKMTSAGQTNRFVCYVLVGDTNGHIGLGSKCAKEVATRDQGWHHRSKDQSDPSATRILGEQDWPAPHCADESAWQVRFSASPLDPCAPWFRHRRVSRDEEDDGLRGHFGLLHLLLRPHQNHGQLRKGYVRGPEGNLWLPDPRPLEAYDAHQVPIPGVVRLPRTVQAGRILSRPKPSRRKLEVEKEHGCVQESSTCVQCLHCSGCLIVP